MITNFGGVRSRLSALAKAVAKHDAVTNDVGVGLAAAVEKARRELEQAEAEGRAPAPWTPDEAQARGREMRRRLEEAEWRKRW